MTPTAADEACGVVAGDSQTGAEGGAAGGEGGHHDGTAGLRRPVHGAQGVAVADEVGACEPREVTA